MQACPKIIWGSCVICGKGSIPSTHSVVLANKLTKIFALRTPTSPCTVGTCFIAGCGSKYPSQQLQSKGENESVEGAEQNADTKRILASSFLEGYCPDHQVAVSDITLSGLSPIILIGDKEVFVLQVCGRPTPLLASHHVGRRIGPFGSPPSSAPTCSCGKGPKRHTILIVVRNSEIFFILGIGQLKY